MRRSRGFTLVEINIAMVFVALLLLGVAATTIHVSRMFQRGVTVRSVNQLGREVMGGMRADVMRAQPDIVNTNEVGQGRLCLGQVSYLFNISQPVAIGGAPSQITRQGGEPITLVRVQDPNAQWCARTAPGGPFVRGGVIANTLFDSRAATELLQQDQQIPLAVHNMALTEALPVSDTTPQVMYLLSLRLGTNQAGTLDVNRECLPPSNNQANFESCFAVDFTTVIRAGGDRT